MKKKINPAESEYYRKLALKGVAKRKKKFREEAKRSNQKAAKLLNNKTKNGVDGVTSRLS
jgi:hypothetical protein